MRRKYCIFAAQYLPHIGGVERYTYNLAKKLVELGNEVTVVTSKIQQFPEYEQMDGVSIRRMPCFDFLKGRYPVMIFNKKFKKIHKKLEEGQFDLIIVNTRFYILSLYGQWFAKKSDIKAITIEHGSSHLSVNNKALDYVGSLYEHIVTRIGRFFCDDYYGVSQACVGWLKHFHIEAKGVLYNSVDINSIHEVLNQRRTSYRKIYGIDNNAIVVSFTGRLLPEKGILQLIEVIRQINKQNEHIYLLIAGDGVLKKIVEKNKNKNIIPLGRLEFEEVISLLSETDIFCLPSFSEGFSTSILEAIVCKCYVVTTEKGGARETFPTKEYGSVIKSNDVCALKQALVKAIQDPDGRKRAVELSYNRLENNYTWDIVAKQVEQLK